MKQFMNETSTASYRLFPSLKEWEFDEMVNSVEASSDAGIIFFFPVFFQFFSSFSKLFDAVLARESQ